MTNMIDILLRVIAPEGVMHPSVAAELLKWNFTQSDFQRMQDLAKKAREGSLTPDEHRETECFERVSSLLGLLKSTARRCLKAANP